GKCLRRYLVQLAEKDPRRMQRLIELHYLSMKALAVEDDDFYKLFINNLPFETSRGTMTLLDCRERGSVIRYVPNVDQFRQLAPVAVAQDLTVVNAGYAYDRDLIEKFPHIFPEVDVEQVNVAEVVERFKDLTDQEHQETSSF